MIRVGIVGATGYTGIEILRLLAQRRDVSLSVVTSRELAGKSVDKYFPNLRGRTDLEFSSPENNQLQQCDVVFFATPHAVAMHSGFANIHPKQDVSTVQGALKVYYELTSSARH